MGVFPWEAGTKGSAFTVAARLGHSRQTRHEPRPLWPIWKGCSQPVPGTASFPPNGAYGGLNRKIRAYATCSRTNGPIANRSVIETDNRNNEMQGEKLEPYIIAPRNAGDAGQAQELQRCKEAIEQLAPASASMSGTLLKARLSPSVASQIQQQFGASLIVERDAPLADPRLMPDFKL